MDIELKRFLMADSGADGGAENGAGADKTKPDTGADKGKTEEATEFTAEQQAKIQELINKAFAKGSAKAAKEAEEKAAREKQTEAERLAADRAELEREKAQIKARTALSKAGYSVDEDTDTAIAELFASAPDKTDDSLAALKKLVDAMTNREVDKRLKAAGTQPPKSSEKDIGVGDAINAAFRNLRK